MSFRKIATYFLPSNLLIISSLKMKVNFVVRRTKKKVDGTVPIEITISVKGKRRYVSTGREVKLYEGRFFKTVFVFFKINSKKTIRFFANSRFFIIFAPKIKLSWL